MLLKIKRKNPDDFSDYTKEIRLDIYTETKKLICDWSDRKNYLIQYRMLNFYVRHGMIVDEVHSVISFKQAKWLEKYINFNTQKRNKVRNDLLMYGTYNNKLQQNFAEKKLESHYMDTDSFVLIVNTKDSIGDLKNLKALFDFSNINKDHELFSNKNKKVFLKFKIETLKNIWIEKFNCLRSKLYAFKCGIDGKNKKKRCF